MLFRSGEIVEVSMNGKRDDDAIVAIVAFPKARFRVSAPPLDLDIAGWPRVTREPTAPFLLEQAKAALPQGTAPHVALASPGTSEPGPGNRQPATGNAGVGGWTVVVVVVASIAGLSALYFAMSSLQ